MLAEHLVNSPSTVALNLKPRLRAAALHLGVSAGVATLAAALVFWAWYPGAYRLMSGGTSLFTLLVSVDVVLGPLLTLVVFSTAKRRGQLVRDLAAIAAIQTAALGYGLHAVYAARPVATVFEVDRLRILTAGQIVLDELPQAPPQYRELPWTGPWLLAARPPSSVEESNSVLFNAVYGVDIAQRPSFWEPYDRHAERALRRSRPLSLFADRHPAAADELSNAASRIGLTLKEGRYLPVVARGDWIALLDSDGKVRGFFPGDGF